MYGRTAAPLAHSASPSLEEEDANPEQCTRVVRMYRCASSICRATARTATSAALTTSVRKPRPLPSLPFALSHRHHRRHPFHRGHHPPLRRRKPPCRRGEDGAAHQQHPHHPPARRRRVRVRDGTRQLRSCRCGMTPTHRPHRSRSGRCAPWRSKAPAPGETRALTSTARCVCLRHLPATRHSSAPPRLSFPLYTKRPGLGFQRARRETAGGTDGHTHAVHENRYAPGAARSACIRSARSRGRRTRRSAPGSGARRSVQRRPRWWSAASAWRW